MVETTNRDANTTNESLQATSTADPQQRLAYLAEIVKEAYGTQGKYGKIHPATKTFQAIRIFVNDELAEIKSLLEKSIELLKPNGIHKKNWHF